MGSGVHCWGGGHYGQLEALQQTTGCWWALWEVGQHCGGWVLLGDLGAPWLTMEGWMEMGGPGTREVMVWQWVTVRWLRPIAVG